MELKRKHKVVKLRTIFIHYLLLFCIGTICWVFILLFSYSVIVSSGRIYPANYAEQQLAKAKSTITASDAVTPEQIPELCDYAVYTMNGTKLSGSLSQQDAEKAWREVSTSETGQDLFYQYVKINRKKQVCVIRYSLFPQYKSPVLRKYLPGIDTLVFILFILGLVTGALILASTFGKKLTRKMSSLQHATEKIQSQDLEFTIQSSGVLEIDHVLHSLDQMKNALKSSLEKQWDLEQARREQMSALAHDIKTPLTVARGNVDLLSETDQTKEQKEYTAYIEESARQMEQYIRSLIEISKAELGYSLNKETIDSKNFMDSILNQMTALGAVKKVSVHCETHNLPNSFNIDSNLLQRAILNIAANAVEASPENGEIDFIAEAAQNRIRFCVTDCGKGFSADDLKQATQQFYMGDRSRSSNTHYGMGLFIAKSITEQHKGILTITNSAVSGGGQVTIEIPVN
jgi:signal transduction histidine kinase